MMRRDARRRHPQRAGETAKNFAGSFVSKERLTTVQYPEERIAPIENTRDFPFLVYDGDDWVGPACAAWPARSAKRVPAEVHLHRKSTDKKPDYVGKPQFYPARFDIDISVCMSCQICVEVCPFEAIKMDTEFELSTTIASAACSTIASRAGQVERVLPQDSSHRSRRSGCAAGRRKAKAEAKAKAAAEGSRCKGRAAPPAACAACGKGEEAPAKEPGA
jgi:NADH-quinone oxidoreductase subunit I